ncbi:hypothetical protein K437DRAFT_257336 [Tilletiaria anomala UBC 951]|uniref:Uncharacterized protein n=1 Tax=Tilletiaria anomala (strain ATCC 24038 / CBS 436.72 / UBC 951) TaxID=1037660 RepID=A0A066VQL4_TILAU|nr:uncharacterized protein K437DRAFT_257336 [Tilletiaria anomala UBC 951]KDN43756.1 hypothetical protein K437DRAFT_257336 [Tilletiaria anomala UBC 951]
MAGESADHVLPSLLCTTCLWLSSTTRNQAQRQSRRRMRRSHTRLLGALNAHRSRGISTLCPRRFQGCPDSSLRHAACHSRVVTFRQTTLAAHIYIRIHAQHSACMYARAICTDDKKCV